jgi:hypothetical protein
LSQQDKGENRVVKARQNKPQRVKQFEQNNKLLKNKSPSLKEIIEIHDKNK